MYFTSSGNKPGSGCTYVIALDSKARLVLPLEIRDALGVRKNEKILFSVSTARQGDNGGIISIEIAKAPDNIDGTTCSKNCKTVRGGQI